MLKKIVFILVTILLTLSGRSQVHEHYLFCAQVSDNGDVAFDWTTPVQSDTFVRYYVCRSTASNPTTFDTIAEIQDYFITNYIDNSSSSTTQQNYYYVITDQSAFLPDIYSDTLSTIHLTVDNSDDHLAILDYNEVNPVMPGYNTPFRIMVMQPDSSFAELDNSFDTRYEYPVLLCSAEYSFRIELEHDSGCVSVSNIFYAAFSDDDAPSMPRLDSVSVDPFTGEVVLGWAESNAPDAGGYVIYHAHVTNDTLDFVDGKQATSYFDLQANACDTARGYAIATYDTCGNIGPGTYDIPQRTILLDSINFHPCELSSTLNWSPYINMVPALEGYRIYLSVDGGDFSVLATVSETSLSYEHQNLDPGHEYRYFIRAFSQGNQVTSSSCIREYSSWQYPQPIANEIENASVFDSEGVELLMLPDTTAFIPLLTLFRSDDGGNTYEILEEFEPMGAEIVYYDDMTADVNAQSYYYKTSLLDSCGNEVLLSPPMRTVFLSGEKQDGRINQLNWNHFEGWTNNVLEYRIYRAINDVGSFQQVGTTTGTSNFFSDDYSSISGDFSKLRYLVAAVQDQQENIQSFSNEIFFEYEPTIYLPNAFTPDGKNPVYRPVGTFAQFSDYRMDVYNRWGELIFTSNDFATGWDGTLKNGTAAAGVYVCTIYYRSNTGETNTLKTPFVLVR